MVDDARVLHHIVLIDLLLPHVVQLLLGDLAFDAVEEPLLDFLLSHIIPVEFFVVHRLNQLVVLIQGELHFYVHAKLRFDVKLAANEVLLVVNAILV